MCIRDDTWGGSICRKKALRPGGGVRGWVSERQGPQEANHRAKEGKDINPRDVRSRVRRGSRVG